MNELALKILYVVLTVNLEMGPISARTPTTNKRSSHNNFPVVLGLFSSRMYGILKRAPGVPFYCPSRSKFHLIWVNLKDFIPVKCFFYRFKLQYNEKTKEMEDVPGSKISTGFFGHTKPVSSLDRTKITIIPIFKHIIGMLKSKGYQNHKDVFGAPYDFRKMPMESTRKDYFAQLELLIENAHKRNGKKVIIISHSMGGPVVHWFLSEKDKKWKDTYIKKWISIDGAFVGSIKAFLTRTYGQSGMTHADVFLGTENIGEMVATFPSLYYLLPSKAYFGDDKIIAMMKNKKYSTKNLTLVQSRLLGKIHHQLKSLNIRDVWIDKPINVPFFCIINLGTPTITSVTLNQDYTLDKDKTYWGDGDGTLTKEEVESCEAIGKNNVGYPSRVEKLRGMDHVTILKDKQTLKLLEDYLDDIA